MEIPGEKFSWMRFKLEFRVHTFSSFPSVLWVLLTCSWEMLKLDLTGHSSHVSFSRNILSSSRRALRGCKKMIETVRVIKLKGSEQLKTSMKRAARQQKAGFVRHSSVIFYRYRHPRFALSVLNRAEVLTKECSTSPTLKKVWRMSDEGRRKGVNLCTLKDFHCFLAWIMCVFPPPPPHRPPPTGEPENPQQWHRCFTYHIWTPISARPAATTVTHHPPPWFFWAGWQITCGEHLQEENQSDPRGGPGGSHRTSSVMCVWAVESKWGGFAVSSSPFVPFSAVFTSSQQGFYSQVEPEEVCAVPLRVSVLRRRLAH